MEKRFQNAGSRTPAMAAVYVFLIVVCKFGVCVELVRVNDFRSRFSTGRYYF